jgi:hypothetical protein
MPGLLPGVLRLDFCLGCYAKVSLAVPPMSLSAPIHHVFRACPCNECCAHLAGEGLMPKSCVRILIDVIDGCVVTGCP